MYNPKEDLTGRRFGKLVVTGKCDRWHAWYCHCDCGNDRVCTTSELKSGDRKSCGCLSPGRKRGPQKGKEKALYSVWNNKTDELLGVDLTAEECAKLIGASRVKTVYEYRSRAAKGKATSYYIEREN